MFCKACKCVAFQFSHTVWSERNEMARQNSLPSYATALACAYPLPFFHYINNRTQPSAPLLSRQHSYLHLIVVRNTNQPEKQAEIKAPKAAQATNTARYSICRPGVK
jgi:hypothetical protein